MVAWLILSAKASGNVMHFRARSALISCLLMVAAFAASEVRAADFPAPDKNRYSVCRRRADRSFWPDTGRIPRQGSQASGVRREQGRCARRHRRRNGGARRARWLHAVRYLRFGPHTQPVTVQEAVL